MLRHPFNRVLMPYCNPCGKKIKAGLRHCSRKCSSTAYRTAVSIHNLASQDVITDERGCWVWTRGKYKYGPHRTYYRMVRGEIPKGLQLDHLCNNTRCVNPWHLEPTTHRANTLRGSAPTAINARKTHCIKGHPFDEQNTITMPNGWRKCRECNKARFREINKLRTEYNRQWARSLTPEKRRERNVRAKQNLKSRISKDVECVVCGTTFWSFRSTTCSRECRGKLSRR